MERPKRKSSQRFQQVNHLCDAVIRNLAPSHGLVLLVGWRHADSRGIFRKSLSELAKATGLSKKQVQRIVDMLVETGSLRVVKERCGTIPTSYFITGKPTASVDMGVPSKPGASVDMGVP